MMKIFCILLFIFFLHVEAQRRSQTRQEVSNADPPARGRGRSRFTATETEYSRSSETISRRIPSRRRQEVGPTTPAQKLNYPPPAPSTPSYAVEEVIDEGDAKPKLKALPEPKIDSQEILSKSSESDSQAAEKRSSIETSGERFSEEQGIPTVKVDTDRSSISKEDLEDIQPKLNDKVVPITRNNVRSGSKAAERRADMRNGGSRTSDRGSRNGNSRSTNDNTISTSRNGSSRSRGENNIPSRRPSVVEDSGYNSRQDSPNEIPSPRAESSILSNKLSEPTDESEIRKQIVRNSMPKLPSPIGVSAILSDTPLPKKTVKKTIKTRLNTNSRNEEATVPPRGKSNPRVVENFATVPRVASRTVEDYNPSARGQSASEDTQSVRSRSNTTPRNEVPGRSRTRATRKPAEVVQTVTIPSRRSGRRRTESATTSAPLPRRGPSVFSATEESPSTRSRTGRRIEAEAPKTVDQSQNARSGGRGRSKGTPISSDQLSSSSSRRQTFRSRNEDQATKPSRQRFNPRSPLYIDESKLEVLPLFEGETKIISESGRKPNQLDELINSITESEKGVINPPENATPLISISSDVSVSSKVSSMKISPRRKSQRKPEIRESVVSQVTEVTSKRTITRKPISRPGSKRLTNKKTLEKKLNGLTSSEEDISDSDNYPAPFKALIQSKKQVKESRPSNVPEEDTKTKTIEELVSSSESPRPVLASPNVPSRTTTYPIKYGEDSENEVQLKPSTTTTTSRPTKKRLSPSFKNLELKNRKSTTASVTKTVTRSTPAPTKETKFHSKFNSVSKNKPIPSSKPFNSVASKGLAFNRKNKESEKYSVNKTKNGAEAGSNRGQPTSAPLHKSSRYSSRYRSSGSSRSAPRTSTAPPAYIPTIPSVRSYNPTVKPKADPELGIEYISFDVPSRSISSANLIKGDYQASEENSNSLDAKQQKTIQTTEKPVSIIERIINSITGINITTEPTIINFSSPSTPEPTKSSAILSLAPKKNLEKQSKTDDSTQQKLKSNKRDAATSEKPTTIIQRILDSLSAIQAATTTETTTVVTTDNPKQVGTNFNTLSVRTTTPSKLELETASFSSTLAHSTTINPLVVLDTISDEQVLQKRTIGKLLDILNSLTTQHPDSTKLPETTKLVYVTPKLSNYLYATPSVTPSGTLKPTIGGDLTTEKLMTSTVSSTEPFTSPPTSTDSRPEDNITQSVTTDVPTSTTTMSSTTLTTTTTISSTTTDAPLSISLGLSTSPQYIEDNILYSTTPRIHPIIMNIQSLLALNGVSTTFSPRERTAPPTAKSLFTPATTAIRPSTSSPFTSPLSTTTLSSSPSSTSASSTSTPSTTTISAKTIPPLPSTTTMISTTSQDVASSSTSTATTNPSSTNTSDSPTTPMSSGDGRAMSTLPSNSEVPTDVTSTESSTIPVVMEITTLGNNDASEGNFGTSGTESNFPYFSTVPTFSRFEVSPDSVSIFSANDLLSNAITPDDFLTSTISIPGKIPDGFLTTGKATHSTTDDKAMNIGQNSILSSEKTTSSPIETNTFTTQERFTSTPIHTVPTTTAIVPKTDSTTPLTEDNSTTLSAVTTEMSVNTSNTSPSTTSPSLTNGTTPGSERRGKLLQNVGEEVSNNIDTSSMGPDYFIFAVLPNNTILRKRPRAFTKETPFVIVGVYPNNTVIRKYPNGTLIPMEPVIRVSGFDTRANPPPLPDITSNQVTPEQGNDMDNPKIEMVSTTLSSSVNSLNSTTITPENTPTTTGMTGMIDSTTVESVTREESSSSYTVIPDNTISSSTPVPSVTLPSISELLNGKTVQAFNSLVNNPPSQDSTTKLTTEIISLEQLLSQLKKVKPLETLEDNKIIEVDNKIDDNAIKSSTTTVSPTTNTVTIAPLNVFQSTTTPSFLSTLITTFQSFGTTRLPVAPTTQTPFRFSSTYRAPLTNTVTTTVPTTTNVPTTTTVPSTTRVTTTTRATTTTMLPTTTLPPSTTTVVPKTTITTMRTEEDSSTPPAFTSKPAVRTGKGLSTTVFPYFNPSDFPLLSFLSTERSRRTNNVDGSTIKTTATTQASSTTLRTTTQRTTTQRTTTTEEVSTTTDKVSTTTESLEELLKKPIDSIKPKRKLTEQQKKDLEAIRRLEQEQAAILKQLSLLTNLNLNNFGNGLTSGNLANRIIALAKERDSRKVKTQTPKPTTTTTIRTTTTTEAATTSKSKSEDEAEKERMKQIESLIRLLNMNGVTPSPKKETTYGTSNDAILAALLKERGIGPTTPKQLADHLEQSGFFTQTNEVTVKPTTKKTARTTRKPKATTQPTRGPLLQRLNWLLDAFAPPPTKAPSRKPKTTTKKPKPKVVEEDILTNEPTHITPVVSPPPSPKSKNQNSLSQDDIQKLIKQLEAIQKDPSAAKNLDLTPFKSLQSLNKQNVQVFMPGSSGVSERETTRPVTRAISQRNKVTTTEIPVETTTRRRQSGARAVRTSTAAPIPVSNYLDEEEDEIVAPTTKGRVTIPPVRLRPVSGVSDDAGSMVRGRLLTAAVNVTRAISGFLGSAFQDAVKNLARSLSGGSLANIAGTSSIPSYNDDTSIDEDYS